MDEHLQDMVKAAQALGLPVYYGSAWAVPKNAKWDYIVIQRTRCAPRAGNTSCTQKYDVAVVREESVPETSLEELYDAMDAVPGLKPDPNEDVTFEYGVKPGTRITVELMVVPFIRPRKRA